MEVVDVHLGGLGDRESVCCVVGNRFIEIPATEMVRIAAEAEEGANGELPIRGVFVTVVPEELSLAG